MGGLVKKGPRNKSRNYKSWKDQKKKELPTVEELKDDEFNEFKKMMEDAPTYKRCHGALRRVR